MKRKFFIGIRLDEVENSKLQIISKNKKISVSKLIRELINTL